MTPTTRRQPDIGPVVSRTVMVVNGPGSILEMFEPILQPGHYDVVVVESDDRAYSQIKIVRPDLVILCVRMDDPASLQVLSMLKLDPDTLHVPIITYAVDEELPKKSDDRVDVPESDLWREVTSRTARMN